MFSSDTSFFGVQRLARSGAFLVTAEMALFQLCGSATVRLPALQTRVCVRFLMCASPAWCVVSVWRGQCCTELTASCDAGAAPCIQGGVSARQGAAVRSPTASVLALMCHAAVAVRFASILACNAVAVVQKSCRTAALREVCIGVATHACNMSRATLQNYLLLDSPVPVVSTQCRNSLITHSHTNV